MQPGPQVLDSNIIYLELELWLFCSSLHGLLRYIIHLIYTLHCPTNNLNVRTKTEPVCTVEADVKRLLVSYVRVYCIWHRNKIYNILYTTASSPAMTGSKYFHIEIFFGTVYNKSLTLCQGHELSTHYTVLYINYSCLVISSHQLSKYQRGACHLWMKSWVDVMRSWKLRDDINRLLKWCNIWYNGTVKITRQ